MKNGRCPEGQYYCYTNKECRPIPKGFMVDPEGMLRKENGASIDESKSGDSSLRDWFTKSRASDGTPGWVQLGGKYAGKPCAKQPGQTTKPKCGSSKMKRNLDKDEEEAAFRRKNKQDPNPDRRGKAKNVATEETKKDHEFSMARSEIKTVKNAAKRLEKKMGKKGEGNLQAWVQSKITKAADYIDTAADYVTNEAAGEKDACYHKVKSRYKVWPSAYASGALVKCRKKGASNWGNSTKKEEFSDWRMELSEAGQKCWKGYKKAGTQKLFGKTYNRCVKEETPKCSHTKKGKECPIHGMDLCPETVSEAIRIPAKTGNIINVTLSWRGKVYMIKMFFPTVSKPSRKEVQDQIDKVYPGGRVNSYFISEVKPGEQFLQTEGAAWTRAAGKNKEGGLNEKGRKSYERENPGSDLKAPSKKVGNPRRASFCARMKGMKKKLTSSKTANDPDSRINKSLRAWNC